MSTLAIDDADDEAGDVVFAVGIEARHLGGLAAEQRAAVLAARRAPPGDDLLGDLRRQPAGRQVVEKEQRLGALHEDVVDAVIHEVRADGVVSTGQERDLQLRADAVGARRPAPARESRRDRAEQAAERPDVRQHPGREGRPRQPRMRRTASLPASMSTPDAL